MGKYLQHPFTIILATFITIAFFLSSQNSIKNYQKTSTNINYIENENKDLSTTIQNLEAKKQFTESDFAKEKIIRDELLLQKPGEIILQLPSNLPPEPSPSPSPSPKPVEEWKKVFFD